MQNSVVIGIIVSLVVVSFISVIVLLSIYLTKQDGINSSSSFTNSSNSSDVECMLFNPPIYFDKDVPFSSNGAVLLNEIGTQLVYINENDVNLLTISNESVITIIDNKSTPSEGKINLVFSNDSQYVGTTNFITATLAKNTNDIWSNQDITPIKTDYYVNVVGGLVLTKNYVSTLSTGTMNGKPMILFQSLHLNDISSTLNYSENINQYDYPTVISMNEEYNLSVIGFTNYETNILTLIPLYFKMNQFVNGIRTTIKQASVHSFTSKIFNDSRFENPLFIIGITSYNSNKGAIYLYEFVKNDNIYGFNLLQILTCSVDDVTNFGTDFSIVGTNCIDWLYVVADNDKNIYYYSFDEINYFQNEKKIKPEGTINNTTYVDITPDGSKLVYPVVNNFSFYSNKSSGNLLVKGDLTVKGEVKTDYLTTDDKPDIQLLKTLIPGDNNTTLGTDDSRFHQVYANEVVTPQFYNGGVISLPEGTTTLLGTDDEQTVSNKKFETSCVFVDDQNPTLGQVQIKLAKTHTGDISRMNFEDGTQDITFPPDTYNVVGDILTQTIKNKDFTTDCVFVNPTDSTQQLEIEITKTTNTKSILQFEGGNQTIKFPNEVDNTDYNIVGDTLTQTLTNKTLSTGCSIEDVTIKSNLIPSGSYGLGDSSNPWNSLFSQTIDTTTVSFHFQNFTSTNTINLSVPNTISQSSNLFLPISPIYNDTLVSRNSIDTLGFKNFADTCALSGGINENTKIITWDVASKTTDSQSKLYFSGGDQTIIYPTGNITLADLTSSQNLTNKTITSASFSGTQTGTITHSGQYNNTNTTDSSSSTTGAVVTSGGLGVAKNIYSGSGIYLPTIGGTATNFNYYEEWTSSGNQWTGPFTLNKEFKIIRAGKSVTLSTNGDIQGTSSSSATITSTGNIIPSRFRPLQNFQYTFRCVNAGTSQVNPGLLIISSTGTITIASDLKGSAFSSSSTCGLSTTAVNWIIL